MDFACNGLNVENVPQQHFCNVDPFIMFQNKIRNCEKIHDSLGKQRTNECFLVDVEFQSESSVIIKRWNAYQISLTVTTPVSSRERDYFWIWRNSNKDTPQHVTKISKMNVDTIALLDKHVQIHVIGEEGNVGMVHYELSIRETKSLESV